jgi:ABC-type transport system substrate-binding protein
VRVAGSLALILTGLVLGSAAWAHPNAGARLYVRPKPVVFGLAFNPQSPLFAENPELARAINFALDRPALIRAWGPYAGHPTARLLPPGSPGYGTRSPYPLDGPHLDTARLLAADNLRSGKATLFTNGFQPVTEEVKVELARIGLDVAVLTRCPVRACANLIPDMFFTGWGADYPDPASTFASFDQPWDGSLNLSPRFRAQLARADRLSGGARARAFAQLDEDVMTQAPPAAPFMAANARILVSARTHCFHWNVYYGVDLGALCVR